MTLWSKTITYLPSTDIGAPEKFIKLDPFKLTGTGEIRNAELTLNGRDGAFLTNDNSGTTPILDQFDKIKIFLADKNGQSKSAVFIIDTIRPVKEGSGYNVIVQLFGQERWLQLMRMPHMKMRKVSHYTAIKNIIDIYLANRGTNVIIEKHDDVTFNQAPQWTALDFDFTDEPTYYEALMRVMNRMNTSIANGGADDFFELYFADDPADTNKIRIKVFPSGSLPIPPTTIENTNDTRIYSVNATVEASTGIIVVGEASNGVGSIPIGFAQFWGRLESFILHPQHIPGLTYPAGAKVQRNGIHYVANTETTDTPDTGDWDIITEADEIGLVKYSEYTYNNYKIWKNSGSNPDPTIFGTVEDFNKSGCWDSNLVVRDEDHYRNEVDIKSTTDNFSLFYKYGPSSGGSYRGLRCLVNGTGTGAFSGHNNKIMQYDGANWVEIGPAGASGVRAPQADDVVAVISENKNYIFNGSAWVDDSASPKSNDCFHIYDSISNVDGVSSVSKQKGDGSWLDLNGDSSPDTGETYGTDSAVEVVYEFTPFVTIFDELYTDPNYYSIGAWLNLVLSPIPSNTLNSIPLELGELYGGDSTKKEPATFDFEGEFGLTPKGNQGWNQVDSEEQGPRDSINFMARFRFDDTANLVPFQGNFKMRCFVYDLNDNVYYADFEILDNDRWEQINLSLSQFKIYRARAPLKWGNIATNLILPELEVLDRFFWKNAKRMVIQCQEVYDNVGRFSPEGSRFVLSFWDSPVLRTKLAIDALYFGGKLIATTGTTSGTNIEVMVQRPNTTNYEQLKQDIRAQKEIEQHRYDAWEVVGEGFCNRDFGESIYFKETNMINDSDDVSHTKKLVLKEVSISINGKGAGMEGFARKMLAVKRL